MEVDDIPVTLDMSDFATGPLSHFGWCEPCKKKDEEIAGLKQEHDANELNFKALKKKIIATDQLLRQYRAKSLECEMQNKQIEEWVRKYEKNQREVMVLEAQLMTTLEKIEPVKKAKSELEGVLKKKDVEIEQLQIKLHSAESLNTQYQMRLATIELTHRNNDEAVLESKKKTASLEQSKKKLLEQIHKLKEENKQAKVEVTKNKRAVQRLEGRLKKTEAKLSTCLQMLAENGLMAAGKARKVLARIARLDKSMDSEGDSDVDSDDQDSDLETDVENTEGKINDSKVTKVAENAGDKNSTAGSVTGGGDGDKKVLAQKAAQEKKMPGSKMAVTSSTRDLMLDIDAMFGSLMPLHSPLPPSPAPGHVSVTEGKDSDQEMLSDTAPSQTEAPEHNHDSHVCSPVREEEKSPDLASSTKQDGPEVIISGSRAGRNSDFNQDAEVCKVVHVGTSGDTSNVRTVEMSHKELASPVSQQPSHRSSESSSVLKKSENTLRSSKQIVQETKPKETGPKQSFQRQHTQQVSTQSNVTVSDAVKHPSQNVSSGTEVVDSEEIDLSKDLQGKPNQSRDVEVKSLSSPCQRVTNGTHGTSCASKTETSGGDLQTADSIDHTDNTNADVANEIKENIAVLESPRRITRQMSARLGTAVCETTDSTTKLNNTHSADLRSRNGEEVHNTLPQTPRRVTRQTSKAVEGADCEIESNAISNKESKDVHGKPQNTNASVTSLGEKSSENVQVTPVQLTDSSSKQNRSKIFASESETDSEMPGDLNAEGGCDDFLYSSPVSKLSPFRPSSRLRSRNFSEKENEKPVILPSPAKRTICFDQTDSSVSSSHVGATPKFEEVPDVNNIFGDVGDMDDDDDDDTKEKITPRRITRQMSAKFNASESFVTERETKTNAREASAKLSSSSKQKTSQPSLKLKRRSSSSLSSLSSSDSEDLSSDSSLSPLEEKPQRMPCRRKQVTMCKSKKMSSSPASEQISQTVPQTRVRKPRKPPAVTASGDCPPYLMQHKLHNSHLQDESSRDSPLVGSPLHKKQPPLIKDSDEELADGESMSVGESSESSGGDGSSDKAAKPFSRSSGGFVTGGERMENSDAAENVTSMDGSLSFMSRSSCSPVNKIPSSVPSLAFDPLTDKNTSRQCSDATAVNSPLICNKEGSDLSAESEVAGTQEHTAKKLPGKVDSGICETGEKLPEGYTLPMQTTGMTSADLKLTDSREKDALHVTSEGSSGKADGICDMDVDLCLHSGKEAVSERKLDVAVPQQNVPDRKDEISSVNARALRPCGDICVSEIEDDCKREDSTIVPDILRPKARFPTMSCSASSEEPPHPVSDTSPVKGANSVFHSSSLSVGEQGRDEHDKDTDVRCTDGQSEKESLPLCSASHEPKSEQSSALLKNFPASLPASDILSHHSESAVKKPLLNHSGFRPTAALSTECLNIHNQTVEMSENKIPAPSPAGVVTSSTSSSTFSEGKLACSGLDTVPVSSKVDLDSHYGSQAVSASGAEHAEVAVLPVGSKDSGSPVPNPPSVSKMDWEEPLHNKPQAPVANPAVDSNASSDLSVEAVVLDSDSQFVHGSECSNLTLPDGSSLSHSSATQSSHGGTQDKMRALSASPFPCSASRDAHLEQNSSKNAQESTSTENMTGISTERQPSVESSAAAAYSSSPSHIRPTSTDSSTTIIMSPAVSRPASAHSDTAVLQMASEDVDMQVVRSSSALSEVSACEAAGGNGGVSSERPPSQRDSSAPGKHKVGNSAAVSKLPCDRPPEIDDGSLSRIFDMFLELSDPIQPLPPSPIPHYRTTSPPSFLLSSVPKSDRPSSVSMPYSFERDSPMSPVFEEPQTITDPKSLFTEYKSKPFNEVEPVKSRHKKSQKNRKKKPDVPPAASISNYSSGSGSKGTAGRVGVKVNAGAQDANWSQNVALSPVEAAKKQLALRQQAAAKISVTTKTTPLSPTAIPTQSSQAVKRRSTEQLQTPSQPKKTHLSPGASVAWKSRDQDGHDDTAAQKQTDTVQPVTGIKSTQKRIAAVSPVAMMTQEAKVSSPADMAKHDRTDQVKPASETLKRVDAGSSVAVVTQRKEASSSVSSVPKKAAGITATLTQNRSKASSQETAGVQKKVNMVNKVPMVTQKKDKSSNLEEKVEDLVEQFCMTQTMPVESVLLQLQQMDSFAKCWLPVVHAVIKLLRETEDDLQPAIIQACGDTRMSAAAKKKLSQQTFVAAKEIRLMHLLLRMVESEPECRRTELMKCLWAAIFSREQTPLIGQAALCRLFVGLCGSDGRVEEVRVLAYNVMRCGYLSYVALTFAIAAAWPKAFSRNTGSADIGILTVLEHVVMTTVSASAALAKTGLCFERLCGWVPSIQEPQHILARLVAELQLTFKTSGTEGRKFELCQGIELLCATKEAQWVCNHFIDRPLRSAAMKWIAKGPASELKPGYLVMLFHLLGNIISSSYHFQNKKHMKGLEQFVYRQCSQLLTCEHSHPEIEQSCAELLLGLAPFKANWIFSILHSWHSARTTAIPSHFRDRIISLGNTMKMRGLYLCLDSFG